MELKDFLKDQLSSDEIISVMTLIYQRGDIVMLKADGERDTNHFAAVITSGNRSFESVRRDHMKLDQALLGVLKDYLKF